MDLKNNGLSSPISIQIWLKYIFFIEKELVRSEKIQKFRQIPANHRNRFSFL